jgi:hypothetical protein
MTWITALTPAPTISPGSSHLLAPNRQSVAHSLVLDPAGRLDLRVVPATVLAGKRAHDYFSEERDLGEQEARHALGKQILVNNL